jgi:hypothetical protein
MLVLFLLCCAAFFAQGAELYPISIGEKHGAIDRQGKIVIPAEYDRPVVVSDGLARVSKGSKTAYLDLSGKRAIEPQDMTDALFAEGLAAARGTDAQGKVRYGYIDRKGGWAISPRFSEAKEFVNGLAIVGVADEWGRAKLGFANAQGELVVAAKYDKALNFGAKVARVERDGKLLLVDRVGAEIAPEGVDWFGTETGGRILARKGKLFGYLDPAGKIVIAPRFTSAQEFQDGMARIWEQGGFGFIDSRGEVVAAPRFTSASDFAEGLSAVSVDGKYGFVNKRGELAISATFDRAMPFSEGLAAAQRDKLWGYIDTSGKWRIEPKFAWVRPFKNGLAWAGLPKERGGQYIDGSGAVVWRQP